MIENNLKKYGHEYYIPSEEQIQKVLLSRPENYLERTTSKTQKYLAKLFNAKLNHRVDRYIADMLLENNIVCEYDGSGHWLRIKFGMSKERFYEEEHKREKVILDNGYKIIRIISRRDKLPDDKYLIKIKDKAICKLKDFDIFIYDIDNKSEKLYKINELI